MAGASGATGAPGVSGDAGATGVANAAQQIAEAAALTDGERPHRAAWRLARALYRAGHTAPDDVDAAAEHWWQCSDTRSRRPSVEDAITEVHEAMMKLEDPETNDSGRDQLAAAFERSATRLIPDGIEGYGKRNRVPARLYRLLSELIDHGNDGTAWLSQRETALLLGVRPQTVSFWMRRLVKDGLVGLVEAGTRGKAATYRLMDDPNNEPW
ncbi:MAG: helix-turn-helix domain-containing protein [Phycisphaeraceae bacterium]